jgi:predicted ribosome quality control (RQC) complex YloA/Tae2 family protein
MKHITSYELMMIVEEMNFLIGRRLEKAFQENNEIFLRFDTKPKTNVKISIPNLIYITKNSPKSIVGISKMIRSLFANYKLVSIKQHNFDRLLEFDFSNRKIFVELFDKGNIIICDKENRIIGFLRNENMNRTIKNNETYSAPKKPNPFSINGKEFVELFNSKNKELVKFIASDLGFGGVYAEEICLNSGINKNTRFLNDEDAEIVLKAIHKIKNKERKPMIVYDKNIPIDVVPIELKFYSGKEYVLFENYSSALEEFCKITKSTVVDKEEEKILKAIEIQKQGIEKTINEQKEIEIIINLIYQNFQGINNLFENIRKIIKEPVSNKEKEEKIKSIKDFNVCEINFKEKFIVLEM